MRTIRASVLLTLLLTLLSALTVAQESENTIALSLSRTACFGTCPVYTLTVYQDGTVVYEGENHVDMTGIQTTTIDPETVQQLIDGFIEAGYLDWDNDY